MKKIVVSSIIILSVFILTTSFFQKYDLPKSIERGKEVYAAYCMSCHIVDGNGTADIFPPLDKADYLKNPAAVLINIILQGQSVEITVNKKKYNGQMPAQNYLSDEQIADVLNYTRNSWSNKMPVAIIPAQVKILRK